MSKVVLACFLMLTLASVMFIAPTIASAQTCFGLDESDSWACVRGGECVASDDCNCNWNRPGTDCGISTCNGKLCTDPTVCSGHGYCDWQNVCVCEDGWAGDDCEQIQPDPPHTCFGILHYELTACNGGDCYAQDSCTCPPGWEGQDCLTETPDCAGIGGCGANGTCVGKDKCECNDGWYGPTCTEFNWCNGVLSFEPTVCNSCGECVAMDTCQCDDWYYGQWCENEYMCGVKMASDPTVCSGNGDCVAGACECDYGWGGPDCGIDLKLCDGIPYDDSTVCNNGRGICQDDDLDETWECACNTGWQGSSCQLPCMCGGMIDPPACNNDLGTCIADEVCQCQYPYTGIYCIDVVQCNGVDANDPSVCSCNGICQANGTCACDEGYYGADCELKRQCYGRDFDDPNVCSGSGTCVDDGQGIGRWICDCDGSRIGLNCASLPDDLDNDGYNSAADCNDEKPFVNPSQAEVRGNTYDDDCDGLPDCEDAADCTENPACLAETISIYIGGTGSYQFGGKVNAAVDAGTVTVPGTITITVHPYVYHPQTSDDTVQVWYEITCTGSIRPIFH